MRHTFKTVLELEVTVIAHVTPATPPRPCMDPDHPSYSDPGDAGECSVEAVLAIDISGGGKKPIDITGCLSPQEIEMLADEAYNNAMDALDDTP